MRLLGFLRVVEGKTTPKKRDEQEIAGYRDMLNIIHESFDAIPITQNYILQLWKPCLLPLALYDMPEALDRICEEYNRIHPFNDGNGRMSRLLTTLLLYRNGFYVGKYISLETKIAKNKDLYYDVLGQAQTGWHEGTEDAVPFIKFRCVNWLQKVKERFLWTRILFSLEKSIYIIRLI